MQPRAVCLVMLLVVIGHAKPPVPAAAQRYLDILRKRPQPGTIFERFYAAWLEEGTTTELLGHLKTQADKADATAADHLVLALFHTHRGDDREALAAYDAALQMDAKNAAAWVERSRIEVRMLDFAAALASLEKANGVNPAEALALDIAKLKGRVLLRLGRNDEALGVWKKLAAEHTDDEDLTEELIDLLVDEAQFEAAIETAQSLVQKTRDPVARTLRQLRLADILLLAERRDESLSMLDTAFATTGGDTWIEGDVLGRIERLFRMTDDIAGLEKHLSGLVTAHPERVTLAWQHALLLSATGQQQEALKRARALLATNPGRRDLRDEFLDLLDSLNQTQEAVVQAQLLVSLNRDDKELIIRLATLQQRSKDNTAAMATLETYVSVSGAGEMDMLRVARLLEGWEESPAKADSPASKAYQRLVAAFPESASAQEAHAHYLHRVGRRDEALAIWNRLAKNAPLDDLLRIAQALQARLESRPALDLLITRETDFAQQPRFLALLVQSALSNQELERALPWALARLRMMHDAEGIEDAMAPLRLILHRDSPKLAVPLLDELRKNTTPSIQDRCLLAMLLSDKGDPAAAEDLLTNAPAEHALISLSQLTRLHQNQQEWEKAAQTLQRVIALPDARIPARVQLLVDLLRRANQPEKALQEIAGWKMLAPSAVEPWLVESRVLKELYRNEDALKVLRQSLRKFPDAPEAANAYATACLEANQPAEAERIYLSLYEKTSDTASRLRLLSPLALAAQSHDALPRLIENFQHRQQQNRASAYPWLALAEIHRATHDDAARRRCLYEASRLRPQDMGLLHEIARSEEEEGLYAEAIRTLETAAKLDKTSKTHERIAKLQIENGDPDAGYRILFELSGGSQMAPEAIEQIADALAARGEWERIVTLLQPVLEKHPQHYRLHYMHGVALEEAGSEAVALATFLRVMDMHEELPGVTSTPSETTEKLPPGTEDWLRFSSVRGEAYLHRETARNPHNPLLPPVSASRQHLPLPSNVVLAPAYALAHVLQISSTWSDEERQRLARQLHRSGVSQADLLLEAAQNTEGITPDMLSTHPEDSALHAVWLLGGGNDDLTALDRCFELFQGSHPGLALRAADAALKSSFLDNPDTWLQRFIKLCASLPRSNHAEWRTLTRLLQSQEIEQQSPQEEISIPLNEKQIDELASILRRWMLAETELENVREIMLAFFATTRWDAVIDGFRHMIDLASRPNSPQTPWQGRSFRSSDPLDGVPLPVSAIGTTLPPYITNLLEEMLGGFYASERQDDPRDRFMTELQSAMRSRVTTAQDARLQVMLRIMGGDTQALLAEWQPRSQKTDATVQDLLAVGWLHQLEQEDEAALPLFESARKLASDASLLDQIDSACVFLARRLHDQQKMELAASAVQPVIERALKKSVSNFEKEKIVQLMEQFDMQAEADKLRQGMIGAPAAVAPPQNIATIRNPYSQALLQRGVVDGREVFDRLLAQNNATGALTEASRRVRQITAAWQSNQQRAETAEELTKLLLKLDMHQLRQPFLIALKTNAASGWKPRLDYASVLDMQHAHGRVFQNNDGDRSLSSAELRSRAIAEYEAVIAANPQAYEARRQLVLLLALEDSPAALKHWNALPDTKQPELLVPLIHETTRKQTAEILAMTRFITSWLKTLDPARPQPVWTLGQLWQVLKVVQQGDGCPDLWDTPASDKLRSFDLLKTDESLRRQRHERRMAHDALCRAITTLPDVAGIGFAPLAGLAMLEQRSIEETEQMALRILTARASPQLKRRQGASQRPSVDDSTFEGERIAKPSPAMFATWSAARRRDTHALENIIYPAILKAEGKSTLDYCRGYADLLLASDADFPATAAAWLRPRVHPKSQHSDAFRPGGMGHEVVRLWQARKNAAPLDELFITYREASVRSADPFAAGPQPTAMEVYTKALAAREPEELRRFIHRLRDTWISPDATVRKRAIATFQEKEKLKRYARITPLERAAGRYLEWIGLQLLTDRSLVAFAAAVEDGALNSAAWVERFTVNGERIETPGQFMTVLQALGLLQGKAEFQMFTESGSGRQNWATELARNFRDTQDVSKVRDLIDLLGRHPPATLETCFLQALLVCDGISSIHLGGDKPVPLKPAAVGGDAATRDAAFRLVVMKHAAEIAVMPAQERRNLGAFLAKELPGFLQPPPDDSELNRALAPILRAEKEALAMRADSLLAITRWEDLAMKGQRDPTEQLLLFLRDLAPQDRPRAMALARHALSLMQKTAEQRRAVAASLPETPSDRFVLSLGPAPELLGIMLALAEETGLDQSLTWCGNLGQYFENALKNQETAHWALQETPFVADTAAFGDVLLDDADEPTQLARIITFLEKNPAQLGQMQVWLMQTPPSFGTWLISALLHRAEGDKNGLLSFYGLRPDQETMMAFIRKHADEFSKLKPRTAATLWTLLRARVPDLGQRAERDALLKKSLQPLIKADNEQFETALAKMLQITDLKASRLGADETIRRAGRMLDQLAPLDKPRAIALLDHVSKLMAAEELSRSRGGRRLQPQQTYVAQWLQAAVVVPELFAEIIQRSEECGVSTSAEWMQSTLGRLSDLHRLEHRPERVLSLLDATRMLDPATTFDPRLLPLEEGKPTLLETWVPLFESWQTLPRLLSNHRPRVFGADLLRLLIHPQPKNDDLVAFAKTHTEEIAATTPEQQKRIAALLHRCGWTPLIAPHLPALQDDFPR